MIEGLPDVELVGVIAAAYLVDHLKLKQTATLEAEGRAPIMVLHEGQLTEPTRFFTSSGLTTFTLELSLLSETAISRSQGSVLPKGYHSSKSKGKEGPVAQHGSRRRPSEPEVVGSNPAGP